MYIYCVVCYRVIAAPYYVRSVVVSLHIVKLLMMIVEPPMDEKFSLLPKDVSTVICYVR